MANLSSTEQHNTFSCLECLGSSNPTRENESLSKTPLWRKIIASTLNLFSFSSAILDRQIPAQVAAISEKLTLANCWHQNQLFSGFDDDFWILPYIFRYFTAFRFCEKVVVDTII